MRALRNQLLRAAVLGFLLLGASCADAKRYGPGGFGAKGGGDTAKALGAKSKHGAPEQRPEDTLKSSADLVQRARAALRDFQGISAQATISPELEAAAADLPERRAELAARVAVATKGIRSSRRAAWIRDIRYSFVEDKKQLDALQVKVDQASARVAFGRKRVLDLLAFWRRAKELAEASDLGTEVREQIGSVVKEGQRAELALARPEAFIIPLQSTLAEMRELSDSVLRTAEREGPDLLEDASQHDFGIWEAARGLRHLEGSVAEVTATSHHMLQMARIFLAQSAKEIAAHCTFFVVVLLGLLGLRSRESQWVGDEHEGKVARQAAEHPFAASLLVTMVASRLFYEAAPTAALLGVYVLAMASALVLFPRLLEPRLRRIGYRLGGFMLLDALRLFIIEVVPLERIVLALELACVTFMLGSMLRRRRWQASPFSEGWTGLYRAVAWLWLLGSCLGLLGAIFGYGSVAEILGGGVLVSMYLALIVTAAVEAVGGTFWILTQSTLLQRLNFVRVYRARVVSLVSQTLRWGALLLWACLSLDGLTLSSTVRRMLWRIMNASLEVGALKVSIGDLGVLALGAALAYYTARLLRFLLEEDVLPRLEITEGSRQIASSSTYYAVLLLGFFFTLAAAGIEFGKLTVLAGALGVGIGFGLQNLVQNFISGLILMFGGPLKIRDKIQIGDLMGEVRTIGFRASTVRTWQGAEVIVPNSKLIADQVINWTLSDNKRRIEIDIGVAYGSDPDRVFELLREIARSHPKVSTEPPADALFIGHGGSSLDFQVQAWVNFDDYAKTRSELTATINKRLTEQKIGIPFPQRDLHLATLSPEVREALRELLGGPDMKTSESP